MVRSLLGLPVWALLILPAVLPRRFPVLSLLPLS